MKKPLFLIQVLFFVLSVLITQGISAQGLNVEGAVEQNPVPQSLVPQMDDTVKGLAGDIHKKLHEEKAEKIAVGQFTYRGSVPSFSAYWTNQLIEELTNIPERPYTILSGGVAGANWTLSGEIVEVVDIIRVHTRLIRTEGRSVEAAFHSDFRRTAALTAMLTSGEGRSSTSNVHPDEYEPDSWDSPVSYTIGMDENAETMSRTLHGDGDEDFFLLIPERDGRLIVETTGSIDTYMHFYNYDTREELADDDDGGQGSNARIRYNVRAGTRYLAKVRGYSRSTSGHYGFRGYMSAPREGGGSWENPMAYEIGTEENAAVINRTLESEDEDFFLLIPNRNARHTIETTGGTDTYIHFYNYDTRELLDEDDDGGTRLNARIRINLQAGKRYLAVVSGYGRESGAYGFRAFASGEAE